MGMDSLLLYTSLIEIGLVLVGGVIMLKDADQRRLDNARNQTYKVTFPLQDISPDQLNGWLKVVWGALSSSRDSGRLKQLFRTPSGLPTMVFETSGEGGTKTPRLQLPANLVEPVISQLQNHIPGIRVEKEPKLPRRVYVKIVELRVRDRARPLDIGDIGALTRTMGTAFGPLAENETIRMQWVIAAAQRHVLPQFNEAKTTEVNAKYLTKDNKANRDEVSDRRNKLSEHNFRAVLRVAAVADTEERAAELVRRVTHALATTHTPYNNFQKRLFISKKALQDRINRAAGSGTWPIQVTLNEFAGLIGWPLDGPATPGYAPGRSSDIAPIEGMTPKSGIILGTSTYPGMTDRPIAIPWETANMHTHVIGKIGTGKSTFAGHVCRQVIERGLGLVMIELEGNLYDMVLDWAPPERKDDFILLDFSSMAAPVGFNFLAEGNPYQAADSILALMEHQYGRHGLGVWAREYLENGLRTLAEFPHLTFIDLATLINPQSEDEIAWADEITRMVKDEEVRRFWTKHDNFNKQKQQERADPALSRLTSFMRSDLRYVFGQSQSAFNWREALQENKIVLVNFKGVPKKSAQLAASMLITSLWDAFKEISLDQETHLVLDEFGDYMDIAIDLATMLDQGRKHKMPMWLLHQRMDQLSPEIKDATQESTRSKVAFEVGPNSASATRREFGTKLDETFFSNLQAFEAVARIKTPSATTPPVTLRTLKPAEPTGVAGEIRRLSAQKYGTPLAEVKRQMVDRRKPSIFQRTNDGPIVGDDNWD